MTRFPLSIPFLVVACVACSSGRSAVTARPGVRAAAAEYFSPRGDATEFVVREINNATSEILAQVPAVASAPVAEALFEARRRGVSVTVVIDGRAPPETRDFRDLVARSGIATCVDDKHTGPIARVMIVDRRTVITGSFHSGTVKDEERAENLLVIRGDAVLVNRYLERFGEHRKHSPGCVSEEPGAHGDPGR